MKLELKNLTKKYKDKTAVSNLSLTLTPGVWGLLGANGAGKTTLMNMIAGILQPTKGEVHYDGKPIDALGESFRDKLGYLPQTFGYYPEFSVGDYLYYVAALKGLTKTQTKQKLAELLDTMGLAEVERKQIKRLSGGMQRRVGIAQTLLNDPELLILDEPTSGLDPSERVYFRNILSEYARNRIVLISTHIVSDVEYIAAQNAIMKDGSLVQVDTTENLVNTMAHMVWTVTLPPRQAAEFELQGDIVNLKNTASGDVEIRYVSEQPLTADSVEAEPRLEDMYLWIFKDVTKGRGL